MVSRRTVGLDTELINELKLVASRRGMSLVSYLRKLINAALELERRGYYAPKALSERRLEYLLNTFNFIYIPADVLNNSLSPESIKYVREFGSRLGMTLRELGINAYEVVEFLSTNSGIAIHEGDKLIITPSMSSRELITELVKGIAQGSGLECSEGRGVFIVKVPQEVIKELTKGFNEGLRKGRRSRGSP